MIDRTMVLIFFFYGLAFFSMGLVIIQELGRCTDCRLRQSLIFLSAFGIIHGAHEWFEMFQTIGFFRGNETTFAYWEFGRIIVLGLSFLALATTGAFLLAPTPEVRRLHLLIPLGLTAIWIFGLMILKGKYAFPALWAVMDVWTRYSLAIPSALLACWGLIIQQREFRQAGMARFGRDSLWAAISFAWYGLIGQLFTRPSLLFPSTVINSSLFFDVFGFPVQMLRTGAAIAAAYFVVQFLRSFQVETQRKIDELQAAQLEEAKRREATAGELLRRIVSAQESERQRIARELHDETGQALTALGLGLRGVATSLLQNPKKSVQNLRQLEGMVARSLDELQRLISDLRPSHLDDLGLAAALRWYANDLQERIPLRIQMEVSGEARDLSTETKTALFRIAQEALTNVIKHAAAENAYLRLQFQPRVVSLEVGDDGCGFDPEELAEPRRPSWGLLGMEERAVLLGGSLEIHSTQNQGTLVRVVIPYIEYREVTDEDPVSIGG